MEAYIDSYTEKSTYLSPGFIHNSLIKRKITVHHHKSKRCTPNPCCLFWMQIKGREFSSTSSLLLVLDADWPFSLPNRWSHQKRCFFHRGTPPDTLACCKLLGSCWTAGSGTPTSIQWRRCPLSSPMSPILLSSLQPHPGSPHVHNHPLFACHLSQVRIHLPRVLAY